MPEAHRCPPSRPRSRRPQATGLALLAALGICGGGGASAALAKPAPKPSVPAGFTITKLASAPEGAGNCDDLVFLDGKLFMGCQNKTFSNAGGGNSTLVELGLDGTVAKTWSMKDKIDGLGSDPLHHRVIVTLNEDAHSHLATVMPSAPAGLQVTNYAYSPDIGSPSTPAALHTGGGTDNVSVDSAGHILITGSHATTKTGTAVFIVVLTPPSSPTGTGTAKLSPTFADNATAVDGSHPGKAVKLALGDVDSGAIVPAGSARFGGGYVIDDQTALELIFASNVFKGTGLTALKTPYGLDDLRWTTSNGGTLYVVDLGAGTVGKSAVYKVTGSFVKDTALASNDSIGDQVVKVNLTTGALTPFVRGLTTTKGLVYLDPSGTETQLPLNGSATPVSTTKSGIAAPAKKSGDSDNTALIVILIVAALLLAGSGAYAVSRRRPRAA